MKRLPISPLWMWQRRKHIVCRCIAGNRCCFEWHSRKTFNHWFICRCCCRFTSSKTFETFKFALNRRNACSIDSTNTIIRTRAVLNTSATNSCSIRAMLNVCQQRDARQVEWRKYETPTSFRQTYKLRLMTDWLTDISWKVEKHRKIERTVTAIQFAFTFTVIIFKIFILCWKSIFHTAFTFCNWFVTCTRSQWRTLAGSSFSIHPDRFVWKLSNRIDKMPQNFLEMSFWFDLIFKFGDLHYKLVVRFDLIQSTLFSSRISFPFQFFAPSNIGFHTFTPDAHTQTDPWMWSRLNACLLVVSFWLFRF